MGATPNIFALLMRLAAVVGWTMHCSAVTRSLGWFRWIGGVGFLALFFSVVSPNDDALCGPISAIRRGRLLVMDQLFDAWTPLRGSNLDPFPTRCCMIALRSQFNIGKCGDSPLFGPDVAQRGNALGEHERCIS